MLMMRRRWHIAVVVLLVLVLTCLCNALPLSTQNRWIVDDASGKRVKLVCAHWVGHLEPMLIEGLDKSPLHHIVSQLPQKGFNCVRLSYSTYLFTRYANHTVLHTLSDLDLPDAKAAIAKHNPWVLHMTHLQAYDAVVDALGEHGLMVLIDNHVSLPAWCCGTGNDDGNGFFRDRHFHPQEWLQGLAFVASHFKPKPHVVAIDLRNELRGARQNHHDWYKYESEGASTIHRLNPNVLVVISGLNFDSDFSFLKQKGLPVKLGNKLVYEVHLYSFSGPSQDRWTVQPLNRVCADTIESLKQNSAFLMKGENAAPLMLSEFGYDMRGVNTADNNFMPCLVAYTASVDMDWSLWAFGGSYYLREGLLGVEEAYAVLDANWTHFRDPLFAPKFHLMQTLLQDPSSKLGKSYILFHPLSGGCVGVNKDKELVVEDCGKNYSRWSYEGDGSPIRSKELNMCIDASGEEGMPVRVSRECLGKQTSWRRVSQSRLHLATIDKTGNRLCLEKDSNSSKIVPTKCICIHDDSACMDNPQTQWFQLVPTNVH